MFIDLNVDWLKNGARSSILEATNQHPPFLNQSVSACFNVLHL